MFTIRRLVFALFSSLVAILAGDARADGVDLVVIPDAIALSVAQKLNGPEGFAFPDGQSFDGLGASVAIAGNRALVGATGDSNGLSEGGSVYAYEKVQGQWQFAQKLVGQDSSGTGASFGHAVAISGDRAVIGGYGTAFVFVVRDGVWTEEIQLAPTDLVPYSSFGAAVSISGDIVVVGDSTIACDGARPVGCAYIYRRFADGWREDARVSPSLPRANMEFGKSVAASGDTILVGAPDVGLEPAQGAGSGSAYVYVRIGSTWVESQRLVRSNPTTLDGFGAAVSLHGDTAAIGAPSNAIGPAGILPGTTLVFRRTGSVWSETQQLVAADEPFWGLFGSSLAIQASRLVIGSGVGRAYVFESIGGSFVQQRELRPNAGERGRGFGFKVATSGEDVLTGVPSSESGDNLYPGGAYLVNLAQTPGLGTQRIDSGTPVLPERFGRTLAMSGDLAVFGTDPSGGIGSGSSGSAYIYRRVANDWVREAVLKSDQPNDEFGEAVAISGDQVIVAAPSRNNSFGARAGSVFAYRKSAGIWQLHREIFAADAAPHSFFGMRLDASNNWLTVGSPWERIGAVPRAGSVRVFKRVADEWVHHVKLLAPDGTENDNFGDAIGISGANLAVGAPGTGGTPNEYRGSVYMYALQSDLWQLQSTLGPGTPMFVAFGASVALADDLLLVGAPTQNRGSVHVFRRSGTSWPPQRVLTPNEGLDIVSFGSSLALHPPYAAIGARGAPFQSGVVELHLSEQDWGLIDRLRSPRVFGNASFGGVIAIDGEALLVGSPAEHADSVFGNPGNGAAYSFNLGPGAATLFDDGFEEAVP